MIYWQERKEQLQRSKQSKNAKAYITDVISFDTETTSGFIDENNTFVLFDETKPKEYYNNMQKVGFVYIWMVAINQTVYYGRELEELKQFMLQLNEEAGGQKIVIYVHNLEFDFQFLQNVFEFDDLFARKAHKVMYAHVANTNITFKCSYVLSALSLAMTAKKHNLNVNKMVGDLDYSKARNTKTELTPQELEYCKNDVLVINAFIAKMLKEYGAFDKIPLTNTGIVRRKFANWIKKNYKKGAKNALYSWQKYIATFVEDYETFTQLVAMFMGGYTHANAWNANKIIINVNADDFTSSYPAVLLTEKYPTTAFWQDETTQLYKDVESGIDIDTIDYENTAYILHVELTGIDAIGSNNYISLSKCAETVEGFVVDNGRIAAANKLQLIINEQDLAIIKANYNIDGIKLLSCKSAKKDYLPKVYYTFILELYKIKQELKQQCKDVKKEFGENSKQYKEVKAMYDNSKAHVNALYGMCCTNYISDFVFYNVKFNDLTPTQKCAVLGLETIPSNIKYCKTLTFKDLTEEQQEDYNNMFNNQWQTVCLDSVMVNEELEEMRTKPTILLPYSWGVWCTSYARKNLWYMINKMNRDLVYTDTDSVYYTGNYDVELNEYNEKQKAKLQKALQHHGLPLYEWVEDLGAWDAEHRGDVKEFKTLGAKKYAFIDTDGNKHLTVSGVSKTNGVNQFKNLKEFKNGLVFDYNNSGSKIKAYNDNQPTFAMCDYMGNVDVITQKHGVCIYPTTYTLDATGEYKHFVDEIQTGTSYCELLNNIGGY